MEKDAFKKQLDLLWEKVRERPETSMKSGSHDREIRSAFELAQSEIQAESLKLLQARFLKEKSYWENLVATKDESISHLQNEVQEKQEQNQRLKEKIESLHHEEYTLLQQSFTTLELQKRSMNIPIEKLEAEQETSRKEILNLKLELEEERHLRKTLQTDWEEKERVWLEERHQTELDVDKTKQNLFERRQKELDEISGLEETIQTLKNEISEKQSLFDAEKMKFQNLMSEKDEQTEKVYLDLNQTKALLDKERNERKLASTERDRQSLQTKEDLNRISQQSFSKDKKIAELEGSLQKLMQEKSGWEERLRNKENSLLMEDETLRKRREEWVESIKDQSKQQLENSTDIVNLLHKIESKVGTRPPDLPSKQIVPPPFAPPSVFKKDLQMRIQKWIQKSPLLDSGLRYLNQRRGLFILGTGVALFVLILPFFLMETEGRKSARAQTYLQNGNRLYTGGHLEKALESLQKAYELNPHNSIIKNSFTLVLGEVANKEYQEGKIEQALKRTELLYQIFPEDLDVVRLHGKIMQAMGRSAQAPSASSKKE